MREELCSISSNDTTDTGTYSQVILQDGNTRYTIILFSIYCNACWTDMYVYRKKANTLCMVRGITMWSFKAAVGVLVVG